MTYEDLIQSMEASAQEKIAEIGRNADLQGEMIVKEAEGKAEAIRGEILAQARATVADRRNRLLYKTRQDERSADIETREEILERVYAKAAARLGNFRAREDYRSFFSRLLNESAGEMEGGPSSSTWTPATKLSAGRSSPNRVGNSRSFLISLPGAVLSSRLPMNRCVSITRWNPGWREQKISTKKKSVASSSGSEQWTSVISMHVSEGCTAACSDRKTSMC